MGGKNGRQALLLVGWRSRLESVIESRLAAGESGEIMGAANNSGPEIARPQLPIFNRPYVLKPFRQDRPEWDVTSDIGTRADDNVQDARARQVRQRPVWTRSRQLAENAANAENRNPQPAQWNNDRTVWKIIPVGSALPRCAANLEDMKFTIEFVPWLPLS
jgi:hypothetical protein